MIVGLDLDNTIVDCDTLFQHQAEDLLGCSLAGKSREDVRALVRSERGDHFWTQIQAEVYGPLYQECPPCNGALETIAQIAASPRVTDIMIISHKTRTDSAGKNYKLRDYATAWIERHLFGKTSLTKSHIHFAETIGEKLQLVATKECDFFLDDLTDIILPLQNRIPHPVLFNRDAKNHPMKDSLRICDWPAFGAFVLNG